MLRASNKVKFDTIYRYASQKSNKPEKTLQLGNLLDSLIVRL